jgi:transposase-like protein
MHTLPHRRRGRPTRFTPRLGERICELIAESPLSIKEICDALHVHRASLYEWAETARLYSENDPRRDFPDTFARAMRIRYQRMGDDLDALADKNVIMGDRSDSARVQQQRLRVETRRWLLSKRLPEVYGDRLMVDAEIEFAIPDLRPAPLKAAEAKAKLLDQGSKTPAALPLRANGTS